MEFLPEGQMDGQSNGQKNDFILIDTVSMLRASDLWTNTVAAMLTSPATNEEEVKGKKTQDTAAMLRRPL